MSTRRADAWRRRGNGSTAGVAAAVSVRGAVLAQLLVAALVLPGREYAVLAVALGVAAALQVVTDSGAAAYLSVLDRPGVRVFRQLVAWQLVVGAVATAVGAALLLRFVGTGASGDPGDAALLAGALALVATGPVESVGRLCRVQWLHREMVGRYARVDVGYAVVRLVPVALLLAGWGPWAFVPGLAVAVAATLVIWLGAVVDLVASPDTGPDLSPLAFGAVVRRSVSYGLPTMASALYSQAPVVVTALLAPVETAAAVAVAARLVQPLEMVAASYSQMSLPRIARGRVPRERLLAVLGTQGLVLGVAGAAGVAGFLHVTAAPRDAWVLAFLLLAVLPVKYLNYGQATLLTAARRPELRTAVSVGLGLVCVTAVALVARGPAWELGAVVACNELLLLAGLAAAVRVVDLPRADPAAPVSSVASSAPAQARVRVGAARGGDRG